MSELKDLVLKLATEFINIQPDRLDEHINTTLGMAGSFLSTDRAYLFEYDMTKRTMSNTYEWCAPGISSCMHLLQDIPLADYPEWMRTHMSGKEIHIPSVRDLPHGKLRNSLLAQDIKSLITVPLMDQNSCLGFVGFDAVRKERDWNPDHITLIRMIAEIYCNVMKRREMERRLAEIEQRYQALVEGIPVGVYRRSPGPGGQFIMVNTAMARIFGFERKEELIGQEIASFCVDMEGMKQCSLELAQTGVIKQKEVKFRRRDGEIIWVSLSARDQRDEHGNTLYVEGIVQDITEKKTQEEEKKRLYKQLQQIQNIESIGRLAGGVAHDFNNLLVPILGYSELLLALEGKNQHIRNYVEPIMEAGERARDIVRQLLAFGRKQELQKIPLDLNETIKGFQKFLSHTLQDNIQIILKLHKDIPAVEADQRQLEQVILNLAVNAQDAMPRGGTITISTSRRQIQAEDISGKGLLSEGEYAVLSIKDTGTGMDDKTIQQIFEPFFTTKPQEKGTGLGLSTVYGIIKQHGGNVEVKSLPGQGTTFTIFLPAAAEDPARHLTIADKAEPSRGSETILLVEDEVFVREFVSRTLLSRGYRVLSAGSYEDVLGKTETLENQPSLLLTDVIMPGLNGKEIYGKLKKRYPGLKVLYMSGNAPETVALKGETNFLQKPFSTKELFKAVRRILNGTENEISSISPRADTAEK